MGEHDFLPPEPSGAPGQGTPPEPDFGAPEIPPARLIGTERRQLAIPLLAVTCIYLVTLLVQELALYLIQKFAPALMRESWFVLVLSNTPMYLCGMPLSLLVFRFAKADPPKENRLRLPAFLGLIPICFSVTILGSFISTAIASVIEMITGSAPSNELQEITANTPLWTNLLFVGILAPILEEIFFRKLVIDRWRRWGDLPAILGSGLLFGLIHGNVGQVVYATLVGMVFGYIYLRTGRLRYTVALHMIVNLIGGVFTSEVIKHLDLDAIAEGSTAALLENMVPLLAFMGYLCFLLLCFVCAPIALALLWKHIRFERGETRLTAGGWARAVLLNPATWLFAALVVFLFVT